MKKKINFTASIFIGMVLGIILGFIFRNSSNFIVTYLAPIGTVYINLLKLMVVPMVFVSIVNGVVSLGDIKKIETVGKYTIVYFFFTTAVAIIFGLVFANVFKGAFPVFEMNNLSYEPTKTSIIDTLVAMFPSNILKPLVEADMLATIFIALLLGFGILQSGESGMKVAKAFSYLNDIILKMIGIILKITPIGVFCLMANTVAVNGITIVSAIGIVLLITYLTYIIYGAIAYGFSIRVISGENPLKFFKTIIPVITTAFTTSSSNATLPLSLEYSEKVGCDKSVSSFVLPLGCTINMDGSAIYMGILTIFIAKCYGVDLTLVDMVTVVLTSTLASVGVAGVPGSALIMMAMVLEAIGLPVEGVALVAGVDKLFDMGRTCLNVTGDITCSLAVTKFLHRKNKKI